ncbi:MAG TPA: lipopolysaccharide biosynthesis protein RfbH [Anaerolineae bacterium]|nr:lipopolysaccharide biosynthesis protein RfbH [Anaerolineae bacterium]HQH38853.1 lipopolysaccharide biosynthesis protein RfbH [Anaerolineae bacterium]
MLNVNQTPAARLRREILDKVAEYYQAAHRPANFVPGETFVNYGGRVYDERELQSAVEAVLDFWLTDGPRVEAFSKRLGQYIGLKRILTVNSGSSANLVAMTTLRSQQLQGFIPFPGGRERGPLQPGDEVITPAATFPTTVAPIVQNQLMPVFIDCKVGTYNVDVNLLEAALSEKTRAVFVPHILGNPVEMDRVMEFAQAHDLYVIEDTCDALGSRYDGAYCGTFGHLTTFSFYPAHHITTGEGGALGTNDTRLYHIAHSIRDWGRDCWCDHKSHRDGECGQRFDWEIPGLGEPYDHRYYFTEIGYNLKMTDIQAAIGLPQIDKLPDFIAARRHNFQTLYAGLAPYAEYLVLPVWSPKAEPAWFAFTIAVRPGAPFTRHDLNDYLRERKIETRYLFAGNILHQPGYRDIAHRVATPLPETEQVLKNAFFIGVYPGIDDARLAYILQVFEDFFTARGLA